MDSRKAWDIGLFDITYRNILQVVQDHLIFHMVTFYMAYRTVYVIWNYSISCIESLSMSYDYLIMRIFHMLYMTFNILYGNMLQAYRTI